MRFGDWPQRSLESALWRTGECHILLCSVQAFTLHSWTSEAVYSMYNLEGMQQVAESERTRQHVEQARRITQVAHCSAAII